MSTERHGSATPARHGSATPARLDVIIVGAGHNGLVAAAYLARAGLKVLVLERLGHVGGLAISAPVFPGVDARLSRYSYLVSLLPYKIIEDLRLPVTLRSRRFGSYTPAGPTGLLIDGADRDRTAAAFASVGSPDFAAWERFYAMCTSVADAVFPTMLRPIPDARDIRSRIGAEAWHDLVERPITETVAERFESDLVRGVVLTDALIGTLRPAAMGPCFLYHVVGGEWRVPVGGMGAVTAALADAARTAGAEIRTDAEVHTIDPDGKVTFGGGVATAHHILVNAAPPILARLLGEPAPAVPDGAQLKINMVLRRLPRLRDPAVTPEEAFSGTFHINEHASQLTAAAAEASAGRMPSMPPCEVYCHSVTDPSILSPALRASGAQTLTLFGLHMPAGLFRSDPAGARKAALDATLRSINSVLAEPIEDLLLPDANGEPCLEVKTPVDLESETGLPGGHIFHGDLTWPWRSSPDVPASAGDQTADDIWSDGSDPWGVRTEHDRILLCGAGARRGGGVSGIAGHNAAMHLLNHPDHA